jgi:hypothetical protein
VLVIRGHEIPLLTFHMKVLLFELADASVFGYQFFNNKYLRYEEVNSIE